METKQKQLTAEDIDAMAAGPEMDALVAERVMGWRWLPYIEDIVLLWPPDGFPGAVLPSSPIDDLTQLSNWHYLPWQMEEYSTDIAAAWQVWETLPPRKRLSEGEHGSGLDAGIYFEETYGGPGSRMEERIGVSAKAETPALAICRAALKATLTR